MSTESVGQVKEAIRVQIEFGIKIPLPFSLILSRGVQSHSECRDEQGG